MRLLDFFNRIDEAVSASNSLYHALQIKKAIEPLRSNSLSGYTKQRFWLDGKRRTDNEADYDSSWWYTGISTTRDKRFAIKWSDIIFEFNREKIKQKYKVIPYAWNYSLKNYYTDSNFSPNNYFQHKKEKEDFIVTGRIPPFLGPHEPGYAELEDEEFYKNQKIMNIFMQEPVGAIEPLSKYLNGIYISIKHNLTISRLYKEEEYLIKSHPLYKGLLGTY